MKSIFCLRQTHVKCAKKGAHAYYSVITGEPVLAKGLCECDCHKAKVEKKEQEAV